METHKLLGTEQPGSCWKGTEPQGWESNTKTSACLTSLVMGQDRMTRGQPRGTGGSWSSPSSYLGVEGHALV